MVRSGVRVEQLDLGRSACLKGVVGDLGIGRKDILITGAAIEAKGSLGSPIQKGIVGEGLPKRVVRIDLEVGELGRV